jgi:3-oxoacyl-[acyl-carrier-protein] synthase-1
MTAVTPNDPVIVAVGMMTAVGLTAPETSASVRSATMRFVETPIRDRQFDPVTLAEVPDDGLPPLASAVESTVGLTAREMRMLRLGTGPLIEAISALPPRQHAPGLSLALPEMQPGRRIDGQRFLSLFAAQTASRFDLARSFAADEGRAGALIAIARAAQVIRTGQASFMLAGAIDTYRDLSVLGMLDREERVKSAVHHDGFIPGEGAAFLLLAASAEAQKLGLPQFGRLTRVAVDEEPGHFYSDAPYRGEGLARTLSQLFGSGDVDAPIAEVFSSMNGESHWAKEWGVGFIRNRSAFLDDSEMHSPADCYGDVGSASGPLLVGLAALGMHGGYRRSPSLVYCSSDHGLRSALAVTLA